MIYHPLFLLFSDLRSFASVKPVYPQTSKSLRDLCTGGDSDWTRREPRHLVMSASDSSASPWPVVLYYIFLKLPKAQRPHWFQVWMLKLRVLAELG